MCFSAQASFIASGLLAAVSIASIYIAKSRPMKIFALTPFIFALQQASEGIIWLTATTNPSLHAHATLFFLVIATVWWPVWIPSIMLTLEKDPLRKKGIVVCLAGGIVFALHALWYLMAYGTSSQIMHDHISYATEHLQMPYALTLILYCLAVIVPLLIVRNKIMWILAAGISASYIMTTTWFPLHIASVWCFFAAIVSSCVLVIVWYNRRSI